MTPAKLAGVIRFHLNQLTARNGHHEFEHLARHLARARVYSNILPATGPVGAGGDQGRDFETFASRIVHPALSSFNDRSSDGSVAFACSLDQEIIQKIRSDVKSICDAGAVDEIVYFCEANVPVGRRHRLQAWARTERNVELQIFDGTAIAELLAERDVFWIAQEFLHMPAEAMPEPLDDDGWYAGHLARWLARNPRIFSNADFLEVKFGLRRATFHADARPRLSFWMELMTRFLAPETPRPMRRSASYEIAVASFRAKGDMTPELDRVRDYFSDLKSWISIADLKDAHTLVAYAFGAMTMDRLAVTPEEVFEWRGRIAELLDSELAEAVAHGRRSGLLEARGFLRMVPKDASMPSTDDTFDDWSAMLDEAELAPLFPIGEFADQFAKLTPIFGGHARYADFADRVDDLLAKRRGPAVAAEKTFERAVTFYRDDRLLDAIRGFHRAQVKLFTGDSMIEFQRATVLLSQSYLELGLAYAAKNVALGGAYLAFHSDDPEFAGTLPTLLFAAANADDGAGNSLTFLRNMLAGLDAHVRLDSDPLHTDRHPSLQVDFGQAAALRGLAARLEPSLLRVVDDVLASWPDVLRAQVIDASQQPSGFWLQGSVDDLWRSLEENFIDVPFGDRGRSRSVGWRAFGVEWLAIFENRPGIVALAEEFIANLQTAMASLADADLCLLPLRMSMHLDLGAQAQWPEIVAVGADASGPTARILLAADPAAQHPSDDAADTLAIIASLLSRLSVLPHDDLLELLKKDMVAAAGRMHIVRPYRELHHTFVPEPGPEEVLLHAGFAEGRVFAGQEHPLLAPRTGPGPTYSEPVTLERIGVRYDRSYATIRFTLECLLADDRARAIVLGWREEGLLDWEILCILSNAAVNIRHPLEEAENISPEDLARYRAAFDVVEDESDALSPDLFTEELLRLNRQAFHVALLRSWDLELPFESVGGTAIEKFLTTRYGLRTDDVGHGDLFESARLRVERFIADGPR
jgi:hypothetical protein